MFTFIQIVKTIISTKKVLFISAILRFSRSVRSGDSADRRVLHGLRPVLDRCHTDRGRRPERRHLLGIQSQPSRHIAAVRRNTDEPDQLSGQSGRSVGPDRRRLRYRQKGKCGTPPKQYILYYI